MLEKKFDRGIWRFLIGVWPLYRSKCIPNTYQIFISNTYQTPISLSRRAYAWVVMPYELLYIVHISTIALVLLINITPKNNVRFTNNERELQIKAYSAASNLISQSWTSNFGVSQTRQHLYPVHLLVIPMHICASQSLFSHLYVVNEWLNRHCIAMYK
jgi:hypothetical protein